MFDSKLVVLKFGGSVLCSENELPSAIHEIYSWVARGYRVVAVVSALGTTTNQLFEQSRKYGQRLSPATIARLAATGEATSAALLGLALDRVGIANEVHDETSLGIQTEGPILDACILGIDRQKFLDALQRASVLVVPGFVGRDDRGRLHLLGRGGSDLTALFLASELEADDCRLVKDVDGLFEWDPKRSGSPRQFQEITFDNALQLDETIVQHKAIRFAQQRGRPFEVGSLRSAPSTRVGDFSKNRFYDDGRCPQPLRVGLLGLGTVGLGFYQHLGKFSSVKVTQIAVRDIQKAINHGVPQTTVTNNAVSVIQQDCDVVVELLGGIEPALTLVRAALESGKHVITANKSLIARHGDELRQIADEKQVQVLYSGSVGGGVPMIETVRRISSAREIVEIEGVLSGTCNFVLDKVAHDVSFTEAVLAAQRAGFAEGDPTLDLNGTDAGEKLTILARNAGFDLDFADIKRQAIDQELIKRWQAKVQKNEVLRQVSSISISGARESGWNIKAQVEIKALPINHFYASVCGEDNLLILKTACGRRIQLVGRGAGRHPTSQAVVNDLLQLLTKVSALTARTGSESKQTISA